MISVRAIEIDLYCCKTYMIFRFSVALVSPRIRKSDFFFKQASKRGLLFYIQMQMVT